MKFRSVLMPAFFVVCMGLAGYVVAKLRPATQTRKGFTLHITQTAYPKDSAAILTATKVRYQKSDGSWKTETTYSNGRLDVGYGEPGRGVFNIDNENQKLDYVSQMPLHSEVPTEDTWRKNPGFVGEETILGYKTFKIHWEEGDQYTDSFMCPALQSYPLRIVWGSSRSRTIFEVTKVVPGEPSFDVAPNYPVDKTQYEERHQN